MSTRSRTLAALLAALGRPSWWLLGLAGFLVRGGIVAFGLAIITIPSPLALSNVLAPILTPLYLGQVDGATVILLGSAVAFVLAFLIGGSWIGAATEVVLIRDARQAALEEGLPTGPEPPPARLLISRAATAHLLSLAPLALVAGLGSVQIFGVAYRELVNPTDASSIVLRVIVGAAAPLAVIVAVWVVCETVGGLAVRRIVLRGESIVGAVARSAASLVRHPVGAVVAPVLTTAILVIDLAAVLTAVTIVWTQVRERLVQPNPDPVTIGLVLATLGAAWCLALLVTGLIEAWRSVALTFEVERIAARTTVGEDARTIGASGQGRPGDWSADGRGGSL